MRSLRNVPSVAFKIVPMLVRCWECFSLYVSYLSPIWLCGAVTGTDSAGREGRGAMHHWHRQFRWGQSLASLKPWPLQWCYGIAVEGNLSPKLWWSQSIEADLLGVCRGFAASTGRCGSGMEGRAAAAGRLWSTGLSAWRLGDASAGVDWLFSFLSYVVSKERISWKNHIFCLVLSNQKTSFFYITFCVFAIDFFSEGWPLTLLQNDLLRQNVFVNSKPIWKRGVTSVA